MIKTAKARPSEPSTARSSMDCSMDGAWSKTTWIVAFWPRPAAMPGSRSVIRWEISTASASVSLRMLTLSAGRPSDRAIVVASTDCTSTAASVPSLHRSVRRRDPPARDLLGGGGGPADLDGQLDVPVEAVAGRHDLGLSLHGLGDRGRVEVVLAQLGRTERDHQLGDVLAGDLHLADALDPGQLRHHAVVDLPGQLVQRRVGGHPEDQDRDVVGAAGQHLVLHRVGKRGGDPVGGAPDVAEDLVVVQPVGPLHGQGGQPVERLRPHLGHPGDPADRLFQRRGHLVGHQLRRGARVGGGQDRRRHLGRRQQLLAQGQGGQHAEDHDGDGHHADDQPVGQAQPGQVGHSVLISSTPRLAGFSAAH